MNTKSLTAKLKSPLNPMVFVIAIIAIIVLFSWLIWQRLPLIPLPSPTRTTFYIRGGDLNDMLDANWKPILKPQDGSIRLDASMNGRTAEIPIGTLIVLYFPDGRFAVNINAEKGILKRIKGFWGIDVIDEYQVVGQGSATINVIKMSEVTCIVKSEYYNPHERILRLGGTKSNGVHWEYSEQEVINMIKSGNYSFYVYVNGQRFNVIIAVQEGREYLKTETDGSAPNNLLNLKNCSSR